MRRPPLRRFPRRFGSRWERTSKQGQQRRGGHWVTATDPLVGTSHDGQVADLAGRDAAAEVFTSMWGDNGNRAPRVIRALNRGAETECALIAGNLHDELTRIEPDLEHRAVQVVVAEHEVLAAVDEADAADDETQALRAECAARGLEIPAVSRARTLLEAGTMVMLGGGDIVFIAASYQEFGLSDQSLGWLPFNELEVAASATVFALLTLAWFSGSRLREVAHFFEEAPSERRTRIRKGAGAAGALVGVVSVVAVLVGLSGIRAAYLTQQGIVAQPGLFLAVQAGVAAAGVAVAFWLSHPFGALWRSTLRRARRAERRLRRAERTYLRLVGAFNGALRVRDALLGRYEAWTNAVVASAQRKAEMYAAWLLQSRLEPTSDELLSVELPNPAEPNLLSELAEYRLGASLVFRRFEPISTDPVTQRLAESRSRHNAPPPSPARRSRAQRSAR